VASLQRVQGMPAEFRAVTKSLSEQVSEHLLARIECGEYPPGSMIPSERELQRIYDVSRATIRQAVTYLVAGGHLRRERGRGTFVRSPSVDEPIEAVTSFAEEVRRQGKVHSGRILSCVSQVPPPHVRVRLRLSSDQFVTSMERLRFVDGEATCLARDYVPVHLAQGLSGESIEDGSLYRGLEKNFGMNLVCAGDEVEAIMPTPTESRLLDMKPASPVLFLRRVTFGTCPANRDVVVPVHYSEARYRADRFRYIARREGRRRDEALERRGGGL